MNEKLKEAARRVITTSRPDLGRLVDEIKRVVYEKKGVISVTEAIGALEIAKLEILKEQE